MRHFWGIAGIAILACCAVAQTFTVIQSQPQPVTESPNASKGSKSSNRVDARATGDQAKKSRKTTATSETAPHKSTVGNAAHRKTESNTAGIGNTAGGTTGQGKPTRPIEQQTPPSGARTIKAQPVQPATEPKPEPKPAAKPIAISGPAAPPYRAPAWLPQSPDSSTLRTQIQSALTKDESLVGSKVEVAVDDTQVNLAGTVTGSSEKLAAERITRSFAGNRKVVNKLTISTSASQPAKSTPAPDKLNNRQHTANMPVASFAAQQETHPADATPASANAPQKDPATSGDQSTSPRP